MKTILTFFALSALAISSLAQVSNAFNYQGVARDLDGNPIPNQLISLRISLHEQAIDGNVVYRETHNPITNKLGLFNVAIGQGDLVNGDWELIEWGTAEHFIEIEIDEQGGSNYQFIGVSQLLAVPYAIHAANGSKWTDSEVTTGMIYRDGYVMVGADLPSEIPLTVVQDHSTIGPFTNTIIAQFKREFGSAHAAMNIYGYPDTDLVYPHLRKSMMLYVSGNSNDLILCADNNTGNIRFITGDWYEASNEKMRITSNGNVQVTTGDVYIEDVGNGVIMKSPDGNCWRMTVNNAGEPVFSSVTCPD